MQKELCQSPEKRELFKHVWLPESLMDDVDADGILRRSIDLPAHWQGQPLILESGTLRATTMIFFNGQQVSGAEPLPENQPIRLTVPAGLAKAGGNVIALRLWDGQGPGGLYPACCDPAQPFPRERSSLPSDLSPGLPGGFQRWRSALTGFSVGSWAVVPNPPAGRSRECVRVRVGSTISGTIVRTTFMVMQVRGNRIIVRH